MAKICRVGYKTSLNIVQEMTKTLSILSSWKVSDISFTMGETKNRLTFCLFRTCNLSFIITSFSHRHLKAVPFIEYAFCIKCIYAPNIVLFFSEKGVKELTLATNSIGRVKIRGFSLEEFLYSVLKACV